MNFKIYLLASFASVLIVNFCQAQQPIQNYPSPIYNVPTYTNQGFNYQMPPQVRPQHPDNGKKPLSLTATPAAPMNTEKPANSSIKSHESSEVNEEDGPLDNIKSKMGNVMKKIGEGFKTTVEKINSTVWPKLHPSGRDADELTETENGIPYIIVSDDAENKNSDQPKSINSPENKLSELMKSSSSNNCNNLPQLESDMSKNVASLTKAMKEFQKSLAKSSYGNNNNQPCIQSGYSSGDIQFRNMNEDDNDKKTNATEKPEPTPSEIDESKKNIENTKENEDAETPKNAEGNVNFEPRHLLKPAIPSVYYNPVVYNTGHHPGHHIEHYPGHLIQHHPGHHIGQYSGHNQGCHPGHHIGHYPGQYIAHQPVHVPHNPYGLLKGNLYKYQKPILLKLKGRSEDETQDSLNNLNPNPVINENVNTNPIATQVYLDPATNTYEQVPQVTKPCLCYKRSAVPDSAVAETATDNKTVPQSNLHSESGIVDVSNEIESQQSKNVKRSDGNGNFWDHTSGLVEEFVKSTASDPSDLKPTDIVKSTNKAFKIINGYAGIVGQLFRIPTNQPNSEILMSVRHEASNENEIPENENQDNDNQENDNQDKDEPKPIANNESDSKLEEHPYESILQSAHSMVENLENSNGNNTSNSKLVINSATDLAEKIATTLTFTDQEGRQRVPGFTDPSGRFIQPAIGMVGKILHTIASGYRPPNSGYIEKRDMNHQPYEYYSNVVPYAYTNYASQLSGDQLNNAPSHPQTPSVLYYYK